MFLLNKNYIVPAVLKICQWLPKLLFTQPQSFRSHCKTGNAQPWTTTGRDIPIRTKNQGFWVSHSQK